jgi:hypothetical protein
MADRAFPSREGMGQVMIFRFVYMDFESGRYSIPTLALLGDVMVTGYKKSLHNESCRLRIL